MTGLMGASAEIFGSLLSLIDIDSVTSQLGDVSIKGLDLDVVFGELQEHLLSDLMYVVTTLPELPELTDAFMKVLPTFEWNLADLVSFFDPTNVGFLGILPAVFYTLELIAGDVLSYPDDPVGWSDWIEVYYSLIKSVEDVTFEYDIEFQKLLDILDLDYRIEEGILSIVGTSVETPPSNPLADYYQDLHDTTGGGPQID